MFSKLFTSVVIFGLFIFLSACQNSEKKSNNNTSSEETTLEEVIDEVNISKQNVPKEKITYTVSLGVMPDNNYEGEGMLIGKVNEDKPAHKAGILKGDIVTQMGDLKINDLVSYTKALSQYKKGDSVKVVIKRDDELLTMLVEF